MARALTLAEIAPAIPEHRLKELGLSKRPRAPRQDREHPIQVALFQWIDGEGGAAHPLLRLAYAIPNFAVSIKKGPQRALAAIHGARMKAEGRRPGMLDMCLPVPRGRYGALYVELKAPGGKLSPAQREWIAALRDAGNRVEVCWSWEEVRDVMLEYLAADG